MTLLLLHILFSLPTFASETGLIVNQHSSISNIFFFSTISSLYIEASLSCSVDFFLLLLSFSCKKALAILRVCIFVREGVFFFFSPHGFKLFVSSSRENGLRASPPRFLRALSCWQRGVTRVLSHFLRHCSSYLCVLGLVFVSVPRPLTVFERSIVYIVCTGLVTNRVFL